MEWIEVSARTLDDARELALDRLGVVVEELEYEVLDEPRGGLFGLGRTDARIRARVKPLSREKPPDRRRRQARDRRPGGGGRKPRGEGSRGGGNRSTPRHADAGDDAGGASEPGVAAPDRAPRSRSRGRRGGRGGSAGSGAGSSGGGGRAKDESRNQGRDDRPEEPVDADVETMDVDAQAERAGAFTRELIAAMGLDGVVATRVDDDTVLVDVEGEGLGILVGPRGSTLSAVEELVRAVVQHGLSGRSARLRVDVAGYRERRREALAAFARQVADEVISSDSERSLEPMSPPDRKVVHDTISEIEGVETSSEGEEPRRRVVIRPA